MKTLRIKIIIIFLIYSFGQLLAQEEKGWDRWNLIVSYNPVLEITSPEYENSLYGELYFMCGDIGLQYRCSNAFRCFIDFGIKHDIYRGIFNEIYYSYHHANYVDISFGIEFLPFRSKRRIDPYIGLSTSPAYFKSYTKYPDESIPHFDNSVDNILLMTDMELGLYYSLTERIRLRAALSGGYSMLSQSNSIVLLYSKIGISYSL